MTYICTYSTYYILHTKINCVLLIDIISGYNIVSMHQKILHANAMADGPLMWQKMICNHSWSIRTSNLPLALFNEVRTKARDSASNPCPNGSNDEDDLLLVCPSPTGPARPKQRRQQQQQQLSSCLSAQHYQIRHQAQHFQRILAWY